MTDESADQDQHDPELDPLLQIPPYQIAELYLPGVAGPLVQPWLIDQEEERFNLYVEKEVADQFVTLTQQGEIAGMAITYGALEAKNLAACRNLFWPKLTLGEIKAIADGEWSVLKWLPAEDPIDPLIALRNAVGLLSLGAGLAAMADQEGETPDGIQVPAGLVDAAGRKLA